MLKKSVLLLLVAGILCPTSVLADEMVVIVNTANPTDSLSYRDVKGYYLKSSGTWDGGEKVRPVDQSGLGPARQAFLSQVLGMSAAEFERYWIAKQYANAVTPPTKAPDTASVIKLVETFKGGIGFVSKEEFTSAQVQKAKAVLTISY